MDQHHQSLPRTSKATIRRLRLHQTRLTMMAQVPLTRPLLRKRTCSISMGVDRTDTRDSAVDTAGTLTPTNPHQQPIPTRAVFPAALDLATTANRVKNADHRRQESAATMKMMAWQLLLNFCPAHSRAREARAHQEPSSLLPCVTRLRFLIFQLNT